MEVYEEYLNGAVKAVQTLTNNIKEFVKGLESVAQALAQILPQVAECAVTVYKMVLTPRQYHLMLHGKKRVKKKWLNVATKRLDKLCGKQK